MAMDVPLPKRVKYWLSEAEKDCFFIVGPEEGQTERIGAIKVFLMGDSVPFRKMLQDSDLAERGDIRITDVDPETFHNYLKCCYGGTDVVVGNLGFDKLVKLLNMTDKYLANELTEPIVVRLKELFSFSNLFIALSYPVCYQNGYLTTEITKLLKFDFKKMAMDERFLELNIEAIAWILQQNTFTVKEIDIWNETIRWAKHNTGSTDGKVLRSYIFDLVKYFRFLTMELTEIWKDVVSCDILLEEEVRDICKAISTGVPCSIDHLSQNICHRYRIADISEDITSTFMGNQVSGFICCIVNVSSWDSCLYIKNSMTYRWAGHLWMMKVIKYEYNNANKSCQKKYALSVYVFCQGESSTWKCSVVGEISLVNRRGKPDVSQSYQTTFTEIESGGRGFKPFLGWDALIDPENGFVHENAIILMAKIKLRN